MTGAELKRARLRQGVAQRERAKELKLKDTTLNRIENEHNDKALRKWTRILEAYGYAIVSTEPQTKPENWNDYTEQA